MVFVLGGKLENQTKTRTTIVKTDITPNLHKEKPKQIKIKNKKTLALTVVHFSTLVVVIKSICVVFLRK